jgi:CDP-glucose 4,6-dehydratase
VAQRGGAVEALALDPGFWRGRRVLVTGHTGFKGGWLCLWLRELGASVTGFAAAPPTEPSLYAAARVSEGVEERRGDVRDASAVWAAVEEARPEVVVHLAAQPLVRRSFEDPLGTYEANVMGTAHVLEALRGAPDARVAIVVTSDKCYEPRADGAPCREDDPLGGTDPYSASKACAELVTASYRRAFPGGPAVASARAGNVIGGGDWATDRLIPDAMRAALAGDELVVRHPEAVRPWQHVLNPLSGYLVLAQRLWDDPAAAGPWNFGPDPADELPVRAVADRVCELWGEGLAWRAGDGEGPPETHVLRVDSAKARERLGWTAAWDLDDGLAATVDWFRAVSGGADAREVCVGQIAAYAAARSRKKRPNVSIT